MTTTRTAPLDPANVHILAQLDRTLAEVEEQCYLMRRAIADAQISTPSTNLQERHYVRYILKGQQKWPLVFASVFSKLQEQAFVMGSNIDNEFILQHASGAGLTDQETSEPRSRDSETNTTVREAVHRKRQFDHCSRDLVPEHATKRTRLNGQIHETVTPKRKRIAKLRKVERHTGQAHLHPDTGPETLDNMEEVESFESYDTSSDFYGVQYEDVSAEVEARMKAREEQRKMTKGDMKRKRYSRNSVDTAIFQIDNTQIPAYKRPRKDDYSSYDDWTTTASDLTPRPAKRRHDHDNTEGIIPKQV